MRDTKFTSRGLDEVLDELRRKPLQHNSSIPADFRNVCIFCILEKGCYSSVGDCAYWQGRYVIPTKEQLNDPRIFKGVYGVCRPHARRYGIGEGFDNDLRSDTLSDGEADSEIDDEIAAA